MQNGKIGRQSLTDVTGSLRLFRAMWRHRTGKNRSTGGSRAL